jgi:TP901 family phage tail tape measure protein
MANSVTLNVGVNKSLLLKDFNDVFASVERGIGAKGINFKVNENSIRQPLGRISGDVSQFSRSLEAATARVVAFSATLAVIGGTVQSFNNLVNATIQVEKKLKDINAVFGLSSSGLQAFSKDIFNAARETGQSFDDAAKAALEFSRQGLTAAETSKRVAASLTLVRLSGLDVEKSVDAITTTLNGFSKEGLTAVEVINKLVAVDGKFAVSAQDLANALSRVGSSAQDAGVGFNELIGLVTAARQITGREGAVIGNSLKTIFTRIQRADVLDQLEAFGVIAKDAAGAALQADVVLKNLGLSFKNLSQAQQASVSELVGGVFQINQLKAILGDLGRQYNITGDATRTAAEASNEAAKRNEVLNQSLATLIQNSKTTATQIGAAFGNISIAEPLRKLLQGGGNNIVGDFSTSILNGLKQIDSDKQEFNNVGEKIAAFVGEGLAKGFGNILTGPGLVFGGRIVGQLLKLTGGKLIGEAGDLLGKKKGDNLLNTQDAVLSRATDAELKRFNAATNVEAKERAILSILERQAAVAAATAGARLEAAQTLAGFAGTTRNQLRTAGRAGFAGGYLPIAEESAAIRQGVGGASPGARPVVIPNFAFGGGKRDTIVANSDEYIVPNFANGGSAIFNQDMIRSMGLPPGATKIAADGYIPNFAGGPIGLRRGATSIGKGSFARVLRQKDSDFVFKAFNNERGDPSTFIRDEFAISKVAEELGLPVAKVFGTAKRSVARGGIYKEFVDGTLGSKISNSDRNEIVDELRARFRENGIDPVDLRAENFIIKKGADLKNIDSMIKNAVVVDPGLFQPNDQSLLKRYQSNYYSKAGGYIPNFANNPLAAAFVREREAGVPADQIYVDIDPRAKSSGNPQGIVVANRRDEPNGAAQGVNRVLGQGGDPRFAGSSKGFIPNFADNTGAIPVAAGGYQPYEPNFLPGSNFLSQRGKKTVVATNAAGYPMVKDSLNNWRLMTASEINLLPKNFTSQVVQREGGSSSNQPGGGFMGGGGSSGPFIPNIAPSSSSSGGGGGNKPPVITGGGGSSGGGGKPPIALGGASPVPGDNFSGAGRSPINTPDFGLANRNFRGAFYNEVPQKIEGKTLQDRRGKFTGGDTLEDVNAIYEDFKKAAAEDSNQKKRIAVKQLRSLDLNSKSIDSIKTVFEAYEKALKSDVAAQTAIQKSINRNLEKQKRASETPLSNLNSPQFIKENVAKAPVFTGQSIPGTFQPPANATFTQSGPGSGILSPLPNPRAEFIAARQEQARAVALERVKERISTGSPVSAAQQKFLSEEITKEARKQAQVVLPPGASKGVIEQYVKGYVEQVGKELNDSYRKIASVKSQDDGLKARTSGIFASLFRDPLKEFDKLAAQGKITGDIDIRRQQALSASQARSQRIGQIGLVSSFVAPVAAGFISEGVGGTTSGQVRGGASGALQGLGTGLAIGSSFGPVGAGIGAAGGAILGGFLGAIGKATKSFEEIAKAIDGTDAANQKTLNGIGQYIQLQSQLNQIVEEGGKPETIERIKKSQREALLSAPEPTRSRLLGAGNDFDKLGEILGGKNAEFATGSIRDTALSSISKFAENKRDKDRGDAARTLGAIVSPNINTDSLIKFSSQSRKGAGFVQDEDINKIISSAGFSQEQGKEVFTQLKKAFGSSAKDLKDFFEEVAKIAKENAKLKPVLDEIQRSGIQGADITKQLEAYSRKLEEGVKITQILNDFQDKVRGARIETGLSLGGLSDNSSLGIRSGANLSNAERNRQQANSQGLALAQSRILNLLPNKSLEGQQSVLSAGSSADLQKFAELSGSKGIKDKLSDVIVELKRVELQGELGVALAKEQNRLQELSLKASQQNRLFSQGTFNPEAVARFGALGVTSRLSRSGARGSAISANQGLEQIGVLDELGLPRTDQTFNIESGLRKRSVGVNISQLLSRRLGREVGVNEIDSATEEFSRKGKSNLEFDEANRIKEANKLRKFDVGAARSNLFSGASNVDISSLVKAGGLSGDTGILRSGLDSVATNTKESANLLADIAALLSKKDANEELTKTIIDITSAEKQGASAEVLKDLRSKAENLQSKINTPLPSAQRKSATSLVDVNSRASEGGTTKLTPISFLEKLKTGNISPLKDNTFRYNGGKEETDVEKLKSKKVDFITRNPQSKSSTDAITLDSFQVNANDVQNSGYAESFFAGFNEKFGGIKDDLQSLASVGRQVADSLESSLGNAFGDFVTGAKSGKDAFRSFTLSILGDASRAFASQAIRGLLGAAFGGPSGLFAGIGRNSGGDIPRFAQGGSVPALLTGGEYYFGPEQVQSIGRDNLMKMNQGLVDRYAGGGLVRGGNGVTDDVPARLDGGGFVLKKSAVSKYGADYLDSLAAGHVQKKFFGGMLLGGLLGAGVGYATGGKKGALIGGLLGGIGGGLAQNYAQTGNLLKSGADSGFFSFAKSAGSSGNLSVMPDNFSEFGGATSKAASAPMSNFQKLGIGLGISAALGVASSLLTPKVKEGRVMNDAEISANRVNLEAGQSNLSQYQYLQINPQGGYSSLASGPQIATRRFSEGGSVTPMSMATMQEYPTSRAPITARRFSEGGSVDQTASMAGNSGPMASVNEGSDNQSGHKVNINISINNQGQASSENSSDTSSPEFANTLGKAVEGKVLEVLNQQSRVGGFFSQQKRFGNV